MECQISRSEDVAEVVLIGSLDSSWSPYLSDRLDEVVRTGVREVRLDMSGVSYLSSNGIALLVRYHRQMRQIGGILQIVADSEAVGHVLRLTGVTKILRDEIPAAAAPATAAARASATLESHGMTLQVSAPAAAASPARLELIGDPGRLAAGGYGASDDRTWHAAADGVALGLGALGPDFASCRDRYGEFLAAAGVAAYRPSAGPNRPDFEQAAGAFVPAVRVLYGMAFAMGPNSGLVRFEAKGEPLDRSVRLSQVAAACLEQARARCVGLVIAGETDGLVGAALRRSPVEAAAGTDLFTHPQARDWLSMTSEPAHARSTALVVGVAARGPGPRLAPFVRPLARDADPQLCGHFHAAVVPFRPLPWGPIALDAMVQQLFAPGRVETVLHLLADSRPILGAGESTFTRGAFWYVSLAEPGGPA